MLKGLHVLWAGLFRQTTCRATTFLLSQHYDRLDQRRRYLDERIVAKKKVGWETVYDESERDALRWLLNTVKHIEQKDIL